jgi:hypothetical protein
LQERLVQVELVEPVELVELVELVVTGIRLVLQKLAKVVAEATEEMVVQVAMEEMAQPVFQLMYI